MSAARARLLGLGLVLPILLGAWLATPGSPARPTCAAAAGSHHVALVVEHGNGAVVSRCVAFTSGQLTGDQLLHLSGVEYGTSTYGALGGAVCQVDGEPASYPPNCLTSTSAYWAMFVSRGGGRWSTSNAGVDSQVFADGDALGWRYVPPTGGGPPPSAAGVCAAVVPTAPVTIAAAVTGSAAPVAAVTPAPTAQASPAQAAVTPPPSPSPSPHRAVPPAGPAGPSPGWIATAAGLGALAGLLVLQLVRPLLRR